MDIDPRTFRQTVGQFVTGVTVVAVEMDGDLHAMTVNSFTSLSLEPPLVLVCIGKATRVGQLAHSMNRFSISVLTQAQRHLSSFFAGSWRDADPPSFSFSPWEEVPRLDGCAAAVACSVHDVHDGGDHWIVVGRVDATYRCEDECDPLVFFCGRYVALEESHARREPSPALPSQS